jgi:2-methylisocitrate lyase-like PEP mutase family enzyme
MRRSLTIGDYENCLIYVENAIIVDFEPTTAIRQAIIEAPINVNELARIGKTFDMPQLANMLEGGRTPFLKPPEPEQLGFRIVICGISLSLHAARAMQDVLGERKSGETRFVGNGTGLEEHKAIVRFDRWAAIDDRYQLGG